MSLAKPADALGACGGQVMRFSLSGARLPPTGATVRVAEAFRSAALAGLQVITGHRGSFVLSGHRPDGKAGHGHRHAFYLPTPDEKGRIVAVHVVNPVQRFSVEEAEALRLIRGLQWNGPSTKANVELVSEDDRTLSQVAGVWSTVTPYVPPRRFYGTHGKHHLIPEKQVVEELVRLVAGNYEVEEIRKVPEWRIRVRLASGDPERQPLRREGFYVRFRSASPLCGPVVLGHSTHFGLGQFRPVAE